MVWYSHLFKNFPQFVLTHTVKGSGVVNEAEVDGSLEFPSFLCDPKNVGNLISDPFLNTLGQLEVLGSHNAEA